MMPNYRSILPMLLFVSMTGCIAPKPPPPPGTPDPKRSPYWKEGVSNGDPSVVIRLGEQRAYFYRGTDVVGETNVSTGRKGYETPPGSYKIIQKNENHVSNLYGDLYDEYGDLVEKNVDLEKDKVPEDGVFIGSPMPYYMRFHRGYGMHAGRVPSYRASHGCVRLPRTMARRFFENVEIGTPVVVEP